MMNGWNVFQVMEELVGWGGSTLVVRKEYLAGRWPPSQLLPGNDRMENTYIYISLSPECLRPLASDCLYSLPSGVRLKRHARGTLHKVREQQREIENESVICSISESNEQGSSRAFQKSGILSLTTPSCQSRETDK